MSEPRGPFDYQQPTATQIRQIQVVRVGLKCAYDTILGMVPPSAERTLAIRKLEEAAMWANKAIVFDGERYL